MDAISPRPGKIDEWPGLPRLVFCWLCRDDMVEALCRGMPRPAPYKRKWKNVFTKRHEVDSQSAFKYAIYMNALELDFAMVDVDNEEPPCWATLCRMCMLCDLIKVHPSLNILTMRTRVVIVIFSKNNKHLPNGFHLSGIAYMPGATIEGGYAIVPRDQNRAFIGEPKENSETLRVSYVAAPFSEERNPGESQLQGYSIHSRCWDLFARQVSPQTISRLDLIASCLQKLSHTSLPSYRDLLAGMQKPGVRCFCGSCTCRSGVSHWARDPVFIPELDKLFHEGIRKARRNKASKKRQATLSILSLRFNLPQEIKYLIAEYLDAQDTSNMLAAFSERFPPGYWKKRISTDTLFEFESVDPDMIDWEFVAQQVEARGLLDARGVIERGLRMQAIDPIVRSLRGGARRLLDCN